MGGGLKMHLEESIVFLKPKNFDKYAEIIPYLDDSLRNFEKSIPIHILPIPESLIRNHYANIKGKSFYEPTINAFLEAEDGIILMVYRGNNIIERIREIIGDTDPQKAKPGTIRHIFSNDSLDQAYKERRYLNNVIHASANKKDAERERSIWKCYLE